MKLLCKHFKCNESIVKISCYIILFFNCTCALKSFMILCFQKFRRITILLEELIEDLILLIFDFCLRL